MRLIIIVLLYTFSYSICTGCEQTGNCSKCSYTFVIPKEITGGLKKIYDYTINGIDNVPVKRRIQKKLRVSYRLIKMDTDSLCMEIESICKINSYRLIKVNILENTFHSDGVSINFVYEKINKIK